jgi:glycoprotein 3-alpha-L-fucosyltransferase
MTTMRSYKFFLALESRNCTDYITEKFWRSLSHGLIPVVIQPPRHFYEKLAPPNSFIHAGDFSFNAQKLADFLTRVAGDAKLYASFSEWKRDYTPLHRGEYLEPLRICELCYKLNNEHREPAFSSYTSISSWFNSQCFKQ